jgi:hypothetical protein
VVSLDAWYDWLEIASVLVIIGVILEGEELVVEYKVKGWKPIWPKIGFGLLVLGLAAEVFFQTRIESMDAALKRTSDTRIAELETAADPRELLPPKTFTLQFVAAESRPGITVQSYAFDVEGDACNGNNKPASQYEFCCC